MENEQGGMGEWLVEVNEIGLNLSFNSVAIRVFSLYYFVLAANVFFSFHLILTGKGFLELSKVLL